MKVQKIKPISKTKYKVLFDNDESLTLYKTEIYKYGFKENEDVDEDVYTKLIFEILPKRALSRCNYLLAKAEKTEMQIKNSLSKSGYPKTVIEKVVFELKERNYINDRRFCENFVHYYKDKKGVNNLKIKLLQKGVDKDLIDEFLNEIDEEEQIKSLDALIMKKSKGENLDYDSEQKLKAFLVRKGYEISLVIKRVEEYKKLLT